VQLPTQRSPLVGFEQVVQFAGDYLGKHVWFGGTEFSAADTMMKFPVDFATSLNIRGRPACRRPAARLASASPINVDLEQRGWMIGRSASALGYCTIKSATSQVQFFHEHIDHPNRVVFSDEVVHRFGQEAASTQRR
jgi:hypothetical protein